MHFIFYNLIILIIGNCEIQDNSYSYFTLPVQQNQTIYGQTSRTLIFDSDDTQLSNNTSINYDLMEFAFRIKYFEKEEVIQMLLMNSFYFNSEFAYCVCQLFSSTQGYYIICIDGIHIDFYKQNTYKTKNQKKQKIWFSKSNEVQCKEAYVNHQNLIKLLCLRPEEIIIYILDIRDQVSFQITEKSKNTLKDCKTKFLIYQNIELVAFYNCQDWSIFEVKNNTLEQFLDNKILKTHNLSIQISLLTDITTCQMYIYLVDSNNYYIVYQNNLKFVGFINYSSKKEILKLIISTKCALNYIIVGDKNIETIRFDSQLREVSIPTALNVTAIFYTSSYLILKNKQNLLIIISEVLQQSYQTSSNNILQMYFQFEENQIITKLPELFYQVDNQKQEIIFYKFCKFKNFVKPKKKYLYQIEPSPFALGKIIRYEVLIKDQEFYQKTLDQLSLKMQIVNNCQPIKFSISKQTFRVPFEHYLQFQENPNNKINNISDEVDFFDLCPNMNQSIQLIWVSILYDIVLAAIIRNNFLIYNCKNDDKFYQISSQDKEIFGYQGKFFLGYIKRKEYFYFQFENKIIDQQIHYFDEEIQQIKQFENYLLIQLINKILVFNFHGFQISQIDEQFLQFGLPDYYNDINHHQLFLQYGNKLFIKFKTQKLVQLISIDNIQIQKIDLIKGDYFKIYAVHNLKSQIFSYIFDGEELILESEFQLSEYSFQKPFIPQQLNQLLVFSAVSKNQQKLFLFINIEDTLMLKKSRLTNTFNCFQQNNFFFYFDQQNQIRLLDFIKYTITLKSDFLQQSYTDFFFIYFDINYFENNFLQQLNAKIQLEVFNQCYTLQKFNQQTINIKLNSNKISELKLDDVVLGPIDDLIFDSLQGFKVQGFFRMVNLITCNSNSNQKEPCSSTTLLILNQQPIFQLICLTDDSYSNKINYQFCNIIEINNNYYFYQFCYLEDQKILALLFVNPEKKLKIGVFTYEQQNNQFIENYSINFDFSEKELQVMQFNLVKQHNNLLIFKILQENYEQTYLYLLEAQTYQIVLADQSHFDFSHVNNSESYLLFLDHPLSRLIQIKIINLQNQKFNLDQIQINYEFICLKLKENLPSFYHFKIVKNKMFNFSLIQCNQIDNWIYATLMISFNEFLFETLIQTNIELNYYDIQVNKIIRNPIQYYDLHIEFYDSRILILKDQNIDKQTFSLYFVYDLRQNKTMYDYVQKFLSRNFQLKNFNSTFYFFQMNGNPNLTISKIGYVIEELDQQYQGKRKITAFNELSNVSFEIVLQISNEEVEEIEFQYFILGSTLLSFLLVISFLVRRSRLRKLNIKVFSPQEI